MYVSYGCVQKAMCSNIKLKINKQNTNLSASFFLGGCWLTDSHRAFWFIVRSRDYHWDTSIAVKDNKDTVILF